MGELNQKAFDNNFITEKQTTEELLKRYDELWESFNSYISGDDLNEFEDIIRELKAREGK
jgi:hypothetical protein